MIQRSLSFDKFDVFHDRLRHARPLADDYDFYLLPEQFVEFVDDTAAKKLHEHVHLLLRTPPVFGGEDV